MKQASSLEESKALWTTLDSGFYTEHWSDYSYVAWRRLFALTKDHSAQAFFQWSLRRLYSHKSHSWHLSCDCKEDSPQLCSLVIVPYSTLDAREFLFNCLEISSSTMGPFCTGLNLQTSRKCSVGLSLQVLFLSGKELCFHLESSGERWPGRISLE